MTTEQYMRLIRLAKTDGKLVKLVKREMVAPVFGTDDIEKETYEIDGFQVTFQNGRFVEMKEAATGKLIHEGDTTHFNVDKYSSAELIQLINDAQRVMKIREMEAANQTIDEFMQVWKKIKCFGGIRVKVSASGDTKHFITTMERLELEIIRPK